MEKSKPEIEEKGLGWGLGWSLKYQGQNLLMEHIHEGSEQVISSCLGKTIQSEEIANVGPLK